MSKKESIILQKALGEHSFNLLNRIKRDPKTGKAKDIELQKEWEETEAFRARAKRTKPHS